MGNLDACVTLTEENSGNVAKLAITNFC